MRSAALVPLLSLLTLLAPPAPMSANPLLTESDLPFNYPRFDLIRDEHFLPAYEAGMAEQLREVAAIADNPAAPTFANTIVALERSGTLLGRVGRIFSNLNSTHTNPVLQQVEKEVSPRLAAHADAILLNPALFARIDALHARRHELGLDPESLLLLERYHRDYIRAGARLAPADQERLRALNTELATLHTAFAQAVLRERNAAAVRFASAADLAGLSPREIESAAAAARAAGHDGQYLLPLLNTTGQPALASLQDRAVRARLMAASLARGSSGGEFDTRATVARLARLRAERAQLLGYATHADFQLEVQTAGSVARVNDLMQRLATAAVANARREAAALQAMIDAEGGDFTLGAADWAFYAEKVRKDRYDFDESELKPYFEMQRVLRDGVFFSATRLFGLTFHERTDLPKYHPDTQVFEVREEDGAPLALFVVDWYARPSKRGGAWMSSYVTQSRLLGQQAIVANHLNVTKPPVGEPTLLTLDEVETAFHEFGHALHGMLSAVQYPRFSGTSVPRDFVEFPPQMYEMWVTWPEVLQNYARHWRTGEPLPRALLDRVEAAGKFNRGFGTTEYLAATLLDQAWHQLRPEEVPGPDDVLAFEAAALRHFGVDFAPVPPRYRSTYFSHIFASSGYSAGYYSYIWSEVLDADSVEWFRQNGGLTRANGEHFRRTVLSRGGSQDALEQFRAFRGGDPSLQPLLERHGLTDVAPAAAGR